MSKAINTATQLKPVVVRAVKALYGDKQEIRILKADRFPLFHEPKEGWMVHIEFNDESYVYSVQMDIQMVDGRITRTVELSRKAIAS
jgi:hypothetical protein